MKEKHNLKRFFNILSFFKKMYIERRYIFLARKKLLIFGLTEHPNTYLMNFYMHKIIFFLLLFYALIFYSDGSSLVKTSLARARVLKPEPGSRMCPFQNVDPECTKKGPEKVWPQYEPKTASCDWAPSLHLLNYFKHTQLTN